MTRRPRQTPKGRSKRTGRGARRLRGDRPALSDSEWRNQRYKNLVAEGVEPELAERTADRAAFDRLVRIHGADEARAIRVRAAEPPERPDDSRYRPAHIDPLLRGPARVTGETARAVKARSTIRIDDHADYRSKT